MSAKQCSVCGAKEKLQSHHISYEPEMTIPLCVECHRKVHGHGVGKAEIGKQKGYEDADRKIAALLTYKSNISSGDIAEVFDVARSTVTTWRRKYTSKNLIWLSDEQEEFIEEYVTIEWDGMDIESLQYSLDEEVPV